MTGFLQLMLALAIVAPAALAQQLPPPQKPAGSDTDWLLPGPALLPPQVEQQPAHLGPQVLHKNVQPQLTAAPAAGGQAGKKTAEQLEQLYAARRRLQIERKQAAIDRMNQFKAARAAVEQKLYQDWHDRYVADAPVRVEYYRALTASYQSQPAAPYYGSAYFYGASPAVVLPPVYAPIVFTPACYGPVTCGTFFTFGW